MIITCSLPSCQREVSRTSTIQTGCSSSPRPLRIALATASLPTMSDHVANNNIDDLKETLSYALRTVLFITIPAMVGLLVLGLPLVQFLFQRGVFTAAAAHLTAQSLYWFSLGLWAVAGVRIVVNVFYALQDIWTPVKVAFITIVCHLVLCLVLMKPMQHSGLALAVSLSSMINLIILLAILRVRLGRLKIKKLMASVGKLYVFLRGHGWCGLPLLLQQLLDILEITPSPGVFSLTTSILVGVGVFIFCSYMLKSPELLSLRESSKVGKGAP